MSLIKVECIDQVLTFQNMPDITAGDVNVVEVEFAFSNHWDGFGKTAVFYVTEDEVFNVVVGANNRVVVPHEVLKREGYFYLGVYGVKDDKVLTSSILRYTILKGAITHKDIGLEEPTPDVYAQLVQLLGNLNTQFSETNKKVLNVRGKYQNLTDGDDWTDAIQKAVNSGYDTIVFDKGHYFVSQRGVDGRGKPYAILIENKENITLEFSDEAIFSFDYSVETLPNVITVQNSNNITIRNMNVVNTVDKDRTKTSELYTGSGVMINDSKNVVVEYGKFHNCYYAVSCFYSENCLIQHNTFSHDFNKPDYQSFNTPYSGIILYSSKCCDVLYNTIYGCLRDGDLSIFGGRTTDCRIIGNRILGYSYDDTEDRKIYRLAQGITYDQGPNNCIIAHNYIYGYYYGIDLKADTYNCNVHDNHIVSCKCGIADRQGEATHVSETLGHLIHDNQIMMLDDWEIDVPFKWYELYYLIGILAEKRQKCSIYNNRISIKLKSGGFKTQEPICGIFASQITELPTEYNYCFNIKDNELDFVASVRAVSVSAPVNSAFIHIGDMKYADISHNTFKSKTTEVTFFYLMGENKNISLINNKYCGYVTRKNHIVMAAEAKNSNFIVDDEVRRVVINSDTQKITTVGSLLKYTTPTTIASLTMPYDNVVLVTIRGCQDYGGIRYVNATYTLERRSDVVTLTKVDGVEQNLTFKASANGTTVDINATCERNLENNIRFEIEVFTLQSDTIKLHY